MHLLASLANMRLVTQGVRFWGKARTFVDKGHPVSLCGEVRECHFDYVPITKASFGHPQVRNDHVSNVSQSELGLRPSLFWALVKRKRF